MNNFAKHKDYAPYPLRDYQSRLIEEAKEALQQHPSLLTTAPTGAGKCHPAGTGILMHDGSIKNVEHVLPGNILMGPDSKPRTVLSTSQGYGEIVRIVPTRGQPWRCNLDHILTLAPTGGRNGNRQGEDPSSQTVDISVRHYLQKSNRWKHIHKLMRSEAIDFSEPPAAKDQRTIPPYILGVLLGDGDLKNPGTAVTSCAPELVAELQQYAAQAGIRVITKERPSHAPNHSLSHGNRKKKTPVTETCRTLGITEHPADDKFIPAVYRTAPQSDRLDLMAGLIDTDGHQNKSGYEYTSKSRQLAEHVVFVARSLGMSANISPKSVQQFTCWRVCISGATHLIPCRLPSKRAPLRGQKKSPLRSGFQVIKDGQQPYYGFTLDEDGHYLLDDFTVTHNTVIFSDICEKVASQDRTAVVMVHRQELVKQAVNTLRKQAGIDPGVVWKSRREFDQKITVLAHGCIAAEGTEWLGPRPHLLIIDEAHHTKAEGWMKAIQKLNPRFLIGFTATPFRFDKNPLTPEPFAQVRRSITPRELIEKGHLVPPVILTPLITDANGTPVPINRAANPAETYLRAIRYGLSQGRRKFIIYVSSSGRTRPRENARRTVELVTSELGIPIDAIDDSMSEKARETAVARYKNVNEAVLVNYATLTEGVDIPETDCLVIGRATRSESSIIQMLGRGIRGYPGKIDCLVIDYTGRNDLHHMVDYYRTDDDEREESKRKRQERGETEPAELLQVNTAFPAHASHMLGWRIRLPWFKPWPEEPLTALCLWHPSPEKSLEYRYIYVRHTSDGAMVGGKVRIRQQARPPYRLNAMRGMDEQSVAAWLKEELAAGGLVNHLSRKAPWRIRPATDGQKKIWETTTSHPASERSTFGEVSDLLAKLKFVEHIPVNATK